MQKILKGFFGFGFVLFIVGYAFAIGFPQHTKVTQNPVRTVEQETFSALPIESQSVLKVLKGMSGKEWSGYARNDGLSCWRLFGNGLQCKYPTTEQEAVAIGELILKRISYYVYHQPIDLLPLAVFHPNSKKWYVHYRQIIHQIPVHNATVSFRIAEDGTIPILQLGVANPANIKEFHQLSTDFCKQRLEQTYGGKVTSITPVWYLTNGTFETGPTLRAAYYAVLDVQHDDRPEVYVSAVTAEILGESNRVHFDWMQTIVRGPVRHRYLNDSPELRGMRALQVSIQNGTALTDTNGFAQRWRSSGSGPFSASATLQGPYANVYPAVTSINRAQVSRNGTSPLELTFLAPPALLSEPNLYWHMTFMHDWIQRLDTSYHALDYSMPGTVNIPNYDNAYWNGQGIHFGAGGITFYNLAMFADVIYHEYTHGITDGIYPEGTLPYTGQSGALNEAWSDYFACTITNEPLMGEGGLYVNGGYMRNLQNDRRYPGSWVNQVHTDGMIASGAFWRTRTALGAPTTDSLIHFAKYALGETFYDYFVDILETDDNDNNLANGTPHSATLYATFGHHGIGPGVIPNLVVRNLNTRIDGLGGSIGDGDLYFETGETMAMICTIRNDLTLYPPPATNVQLRFECNDVGLQLPAPMALGVFPAGYEVTVGPLMFQNLSGTPRYTWLKIIRTANGNYVATDSIKLLLGVPNLAVISMDTSRFLQSFVTEALDSLSVPYFAYVGTSNTVRLSLFQTHTQVFWLGGNSRNVFTPALVNGLVDFLDRGGKLLISGQHISELQQYPSLLERLKVDIATDSIRPLTVVGNPLSNLSIGRLYIVGGVGACNQVAPDGLNPRDGGIEVYRYENANYSACIAFGTEDPQQARTITFGFGIEGIHRSGNRTSVQQVLAPILDWFQGTTNIPIGLNTLPTHYQLHQNFPNPFNPSTEIRFDLPKDGFTKLTVYNLLGQKVVELLNQSLPAGYHSVRFDASQLAAGVYVYQLESGGYHSFKKMILVK
ncbi:MAG: T9SS type A sorting domain-containing protein [bacterium]|nr:T9SS type A sorting domain-containing protein [bacterium]